MFICICVICDRLALCSMVLYLWTCSCTWNTSTLTHHSEVFYTYVTEVVTDIRRLGGMDLQVFRCMVLVCFSIRQIKHQVLGTHTYSIVIPSDVSRYENVMWKHCRSFGFRLTESFKSIHFAHPTPWKHLPHAWAHSPTQIWVSEPFSNSYNQKSPGSSSETPCIWLHPFSLLDKFPSPRIGWMLRQEQLVVCG